MTLDSAMSPWVMFLKSLNSWRGEGWHLGDLLHLVGYPSKLSLLFGWFLLREMSVSVA